MGIGKRLYPDDEISASDNQAARRNRRRSADPIVTRFVGGCNWQTAPTRDWIQDHRQAEHTTIFAKQVETTTIWRNRPVPRSANYHYDRLTSEQATIAARVKSLSLTTDGSTFYFY
jgi:hypothetical protein